MLNKNELLDKNRILTQEALREKIDRLGSCAGLSVEHKDEDKEVCSNSLYAALQIIASEYNLQLKNTDTLLSVHSDLSWDEQLKLVVEKNNWRMRQVFLTEHFYSLSLRNFLSYLSLKLQYSSMHLLTETKPNPMKYITL